MHVDRIVKIISIVNKHSCVQVLQSRLWLSFEVGMLDHTADSTHCKAYHELALMRQLISAVFFQFRGVAYKQHHKKKQ